MLKVECSVSNEFKHVQNSQLCTSTRTSVRMYVYVCASGIFPISSASHALPATFYPALIASILHVGQTLICLVCVTCSRSYTQKGWDICIARAYPTDHYVDRVQIIQIVIYQSQERTLFVRSVTYRLVPLPIVGYVTLEI